MKALSHLPSSQGMAAMQSINLVILNPAFFVVFFGTSAACLLVVITALSNDLSPGSEFVLGGGILYLVGSLLVTAAFNVPLNNALAAADPEAPDSESFWADYLGKWTAWNHARTVASILATASFVIAIGQWSVQ
jgi:uncharacterized membrane protein